MKISDSHQQSHTSNLRSEQPFLGAKAEQAFFGKGRSPSTPFFNPSSTSSPPVQAKLTVGALGDRYEQEADPLRVSRSARVASQVVDQINNPSVQQGGDRSSVQRMGKEDDELQMKPVLQKKTSPEEDELQMKPMAEPVQRQDDLLNDKLLQGKTALTGAPTQLQSTSAAGENRTGMPDQLKSGVEQLSGVDMSNVRIYYNSDKPAQLNAYAYAQGTDIHLASGQEQHLPHEAWHVVQQMQGRVRPTVQIQGKVNINDDGGLENEADVMGAKALQMKSPKNSLTLTRIAANPRSLSSGKVQKVLNSNVIQKYDKPLHEAITKLGDYSFKDPFMQYTKAANQSRDAVNWKAHVGVQNAKDRMQALEEAGPVLRGLGLNHKFDIRDAKDGIQFQKFITIYPPQEESDWLEIVTSMEKAISVATYFDENAEAGVMGGKIAMRHGQIGAVTPQHIEEAGIELTKIKTADVITEYSINDATKVWDVAYQDKLVFHAKAGACFFLMKEPFPAIIWKGVLRPDRREDWNPFKAELPEGIKTTKEIEWEQKITAYRTSEMYKNREMVLAAKGVSNRYGIF